jgi:hypothetical protein
MKGQTKKAAALAAVLTGMLVSGAALGRDPGSCLEAYLQSGLTEQQSTFDDFRHSYSDTLCATEDGDGVVATTYSGVSGQTS